MQQSNYNRTPDISSAPQQLQQLTNMMQSQQDRQQNREREHLRPDGKKWPSLYVGNLPDKSFFDLDLLKFFSSAGFKIKTATVANDTDKNKSLGYGYISFAEESELERCLSTMNNALCHDRMIILNRQGEKNFNPKANIIIRNLSKTVTQNDVYQAFSKFGKIHSCKL